MMFRTVARLRTRHTRPRSRASQLLEFTLLLPMAVLLIAFSVDMGRLVLGTTGLADSAAVAARAAARVGYAGYSPSPGNCVDATSADQTAYHAFCQSASVLGGATIASFDILSPVTGADHACVLGSDETEFVTVKATAELELITPGLTSLIKLAVPGTSMIEVTGTARCEVTR